MEWRADWRAYGQADKTGGQADKRTSGQAEKVEIS